MDYRRIKKEEQLAPHMVLNNMKFYSITGISLATHLALKEYV